MLMNDRIKNMENILKAFGLDLRTRNKLRNVILHLREYGKTVDDFIEYADAKMIERQEQLEQEERFRAKQNLYSLPCPECQTLMVLRPINIDPSTQTGDDSQTVWLCPNLKCMHTKYSEKTLEQWQDELKRRI